MTARCLLCSIAALLALGAGPPPGPNQKKPPPLAARTPEQVRAARDFQFESVTIGTSRDEFLERHPGAKLREAELNEAIGIECYRVDELESVDSAEFLFVDGALYKVTAHYSPARLKEMGGETIPLRKLVHKLGRQDPNSPGLKKDKAGESFTAQWEFPEIHRRIALVATAKVTVVMFSDTAKLALVKHRTTARANLGF